jgi:glycosyltransferase involved in cell wall biosynthesis
MGLPLSASEHRQLVFKTAVGSLVFTRVRGRRTFAVNVEVRKPKILFVFNNVLGHRTYSAQLTRVLATRDDIQYAVLQIRTPKIVRALLKRHNASLVGRVIRHIDPILAFGSVLGQQVRREINRQRPDLIHFAPQWPAGSVAMSAPRVPFTAALDCTRANMEASFSKRAWTEANIRSERQVFAQASRLYPWSRWAAQSLVNDYSVPEQNIRVILPCTDLAAIPRAVHQNDRHSVPKIIFIGNDFHRKGGDLLHGWIKGPLAGLGELHIVSGDRQAPGSSQNVYSYGRVPNERLVKELLPQMDLLCHPTRSDMSAYVVVEASAAGLPSVASAIGGIPDLISQGSSGFLVPPNDEAGFLAALKTLLSSRELRQQMGQAARQIALESFSADKNFNVLIDDLKAIALERQLEAPMYAGPIHEQQRLRA